MFINYVIKAFWYLLILIIVFDETNPIRSRKETLDDITDSLEDMHIHKKGHKGKGNGNNEDSQIDEIKTSTDTNLPKGWRTSRYHPLDNIIGDISKGLTTRHSLSLYSLIQSSHLIDPALSLPPSQCTVTTSLSLSAF